MDGTHLTEDMDKQLAVVNTAMNFRVPLNEVDFFQLLRNYYLLKKDSAPCNYYYYYYYYYYYTVAVVAVLSKNFAPKQTPSEQ